MRIERLCAMAVSREATQILKVKTNSGKMMTHMTQLEVR